MRFNCMIKNERDGGRKYEWRREKKKDRGDHQKQ
jgi:hypothetical protein